MPRHNWAQSGLSADYDAFKFCGDYAEGRQHVYAGCACLVVKVPDDALAGAPCAITQVAADVFGDRWLQDGARVFMRLTDDAAPLHETRLVEALPDATAALMAVTPSNDGADSSAAVSLAPSQPQPANPARFIHLHLVLADYLTHRGAWVEGSATLDAESVRVTYSRDVAPDVSEPDRNLRVALHLADDSAAVHFQRAAGNIADPWFARHWAAKMLLDGDLAASTSPTPLTRGHLQIMAPRVTLSGGLAGAFACSIGFYCPVKAIQNSLLWLVPGEAFAGNGSRIRFWVYTGSSAPDPAKPETWSGTAPGCIGGAAFGALAVGEPVGIPVRAVAAGRVWVLACVEEVGFADGAADVGFTLGVGMNLWNAHLARAYIHEPGSRGFVWRVFNPAPYFPGAAEFWTAIGDSPHLPNVLGNTWNNYTGAVHDGIASWGEWRDKDGAVPPFMPMNGILPTTGGAFGVRNDGTPMYAGQKPGFWEAVKDLTLVTFTQFNGDVIYAQTHEGPFELGLTSMPPDAKALLMGGWQRDVQRMNAIVNAPAGYAVINPFGIVDNGLAPALAAWPWGYPQIHFPIAALLAGDGTVKSADMTGGGLVDTTAWTGIQCISVQPDFIVGVKHGGSVLFTGNAASYSAIQAQLAGRHVFFVVPSKCPTLAFCCAD
jgi:hypothetical protein